jgi:hypothetical protein
MDAVWVRQSITEATRSEGWPSAHSHHNSKSVPRGCAVTLGIDPVLTAERNTLESGFLHGRLITLRDFRLTRQACTRMPVTDSLEARSLVRAGVKERRPYSRKVRPWLSPYCAVLRTSTRVAALKCVKCPDLCYPGHISCFEVTCRIRRPAAIGDVSRARFAAWREGKC